MTDPLRVAHPKPRRMFEIPSNEPSSPPTPTEQPNGHNTDFLNVKDTFESNRTRSILNLTSSTLFGIYQPTAFDTPRDDNSPWGTEVSTPALSPSAELRKEAAAAQRQRPSFVRRRTRRQYVLDDDTLTLLFKATLVFGCGVVYGTIMAHLHENEWITPVQMELIDRSSWRYLGLWGIGGVALAGVLPWLDNTFQTTTDFKSKRNESDRAPSAWSLAVRSIGAFVGIAFALVWVPLYSLFHGINCPGFRLRYANKIKQRRLPWESTSQVSLTLALVNPFLWYLIDHTRTGFWLSTVVGISGMAIILSVHPGMIPTSSVGIGFQDWRLQSDVPGGVSQEAVAVATWLASVLFSACVCFGNIGRQLSLQGGHEDDIPKSDRLSIRKYIFWR